MNFAGVNVYLVRLFAMTLVYCSLSCQLTPSRVYQSIVIPSAPEIQLNEQTVLVDVRPSLDFQMGHLSGALFVRPEDYYQTQTPFQGLLDADKFYLTRRLARLGISPTTPVVVVGRGLREAQFAWVLRYLGVQNVRYAHIDYFKSPLTSDKAELRAAQPIWNPILNEKLIVSAKNLKGKVLDVSSDAHFLESASLRSKTSLAIEHLSWDQFFTEKGLPNFAVKSKLKSLGFVEDSEVVVIDEKGEASAAVAAALMDIGFSRVYNASGGYQELSYSK